MNSLTSIELLFVIAIIAAQTIIALKTFRNIDLLETIIPDVKFFKVKYYSIAFELLQNLQPSEIMSKLPQFEKRKLPHKLTTATAGDNGWNENEEYEEEYASEICLINPTDSTNQVFDDVKLSINTYLIRNKGAVTDFTLIKDIVERNLETEEDEITQLATIPLYLGLLGTMLGIIFGLINLFIVSTATGGEFKIESFLIAVSIAMVASFWGLFCSVGNTNFKYRIAKKNLEKSKNGFYTFVQTELLPILNLNISSSVYTLHQNLVQFNDNFTANLHRLSTMLNKNHDALIAQEKVLTALENMEITEIVKANVVVHKELKAGIKQLEKFNDYINNLNEFVEGTRRLSTSFEDLLNRSNNFHKLGEKLESRIDDSNKLVSFLTEHYSQLQLTGAQMRESVTKVEDVLIKSLKQLEDHTQLKIQAIKEITIKEEDMMSKALADNRNNLTKLGLLEDMTKHISEFKVSSASQIGSLKNEVKDLKQSMIELSSRSQKSLEVLQEINNNSLLHKAQNITGSFMKMFSRKSDEEEK